LDCACFATIVRTDKDGWVIEFDSLFVAEEFEILNFNVM